jgi:hypothetical protein
MNIRRLIRQWRAPAQMLAAIGAIVVFIKTQAIPYFAKGDDGPAWVIHQAWLEGGLVGEKARVMLSVDKLRACSPKLASLVIVDNRGSQFTVKHNIGEFPLPVGMNQSPTYYWQIPEDMAPGEIASGYIEIYHHECQEGSSPKLPATAETDKPKILRNTRVGPQAL